MENQVKEEIIKWITKPENEELLKTLKLIKETSESGDWIDDLSEREKESVAKGQEEHERGDTLTSNEFWENAR